MIYDTVENLLLYRGLSKNLDTAIRYILNNELDTLPAGKTVIDGENVYVNVIEAATIPGDKAQYEMHKNYIDLQVMLKGTELFEVALGEAAVTKPYESASDSCLVRADTSAVGTLCEGRFVIFPTMEPHKPMIRAQGCDKVRKAVFKVKDEDAE